MKLFKIAQPYGEDGQGIDPQMQENINIVLQAYSTLQKTTQDVSTAVETIEQSGISQLFQKDTLVNAIQSGDVSQLNQGNIDQALQAMNIIISSVPTLQTAMRTIEQYQDIAPLLNLNVSALQSEVITSIQSGQMGNLPNYKPQM